MGKVCDVCGRHYKRGTCEYCQREHKWTRELEHDYMVRLFPARIRRDLQHGTFDQSELEEDFNWLKEGDPVKVGLYMTGAPGTGKTVYASKLMLHVAYYREVNKDKRWRSFEFISVPELLVELKTTYEPDSGSTEIQVINKYSGCDFLVLDDISAERTNEWAFQALYLIINRRYEWLRTTIFTSNLSLEALAEKLGDDRIPSRINSMTKVKVFKKVLR